ncbi:hypothetical protein SAMN04487786_1113 [Paenisporosarcina quisquiliarum]|nr:hypothetical protein SAMN04487786_1113 [Paenisporosarcina quisquiliarum]
MLVQFTIENFRSILEKKTFSMQTGPYLKKYKESNTFNSTPVNLLKSAAIFGPNGSGKTNIIEAMNVVKNMIINSYRISAKKSVNLPFHPFKMLNNGKQETMFEILLLINNKLYEYKYIYNSEMIIFESLNILSSNEDRIIFIRDFNFESKHYEYEINDIPDFREKTKKNALYLTTLSEFNDDFNEFEGKEVYNWFLDSLEIVEADDNSIPERLAKKLKNPEIKENLLQFLKIADFNIVDIETRTRKTEVPEHFKALMNTEFNQEVDDFFEFTDVYTVYNQYDIDGNIVGKSNIHTQSFESRGTVKMINLALILLDATEMPRTVFIDEFDNALHYEISLFLIKIFNNELYNKKSQFIFNTHDLSLLDSDVLRIDQIWFAEKSKNNTTDFYSLYDFNETSNRARSDVSYAKNYIKGKFGALPIINDSLFNKNIFNLGD